MKLLNLIDKCSNFEKLATQQSVSIEACRSGNSFDLIPAQNGSLGPGYYFTTNKDRALKYSDLSRCIIWVNINFQNPLVGDKLNIAAQLGLQNHVDEDSGAYDFNIGKQLSIIAKEQGYDGIIAKESNGKYYEVVAFNQNSFSPIRKECLNETML